VSKVPDQCHSCGGAKVPGHECPPDIKREKVWKKKQIDAALLHISDLTEKIVTLADEIAELRKDDKNDAIVASRCADEIERLTTESGEFDACCTDQKLEIERLTIEHGEMNEANVRYEKENERLTAEVKSAFIAGYDIARIDARYYSPPRAIGAFNEYCSTVSGKQSSDFSKFIREGTPEEKERVYGAVIDNSSKSQQKRIAVQAGDSKRT
jgi:hypothetical protein